VVIATAQHRQDRVEGVAVFDDQKNITISDRLTMQTGYYSPAAQKVQGEAHRAE
jgi:hypothetical protein